MPIQVEKCVEKLKAHNVSSDIAWGKCQNWDKAGKLREDGSVITKQSLDVRVDSFEGASQVEISMLDPLKSVYIVTPVGEDRILQYMFDLEDQEANWTWETALKYIDKHDKGNVMQSILNGGIDNEDPVIQDYAQHLTPEKLEKLKKVDSDPFFVKLRITYGLGSNKQFFDEKFFQKAGAKFEGTPLFLNHSGLVEFGKGIPIGSVVKFLGTSPDGADFLSYVSASEGTLRQKIRESLALGDLGYIRKISMEGIPGKGDYRMDKKTGVKYYNDLANPTGIAIVNKEGLKNSQITEA